MTAYLDDAGRGRTAISHTFRDARQNQTDANKDRGRRKKMVAVMFCAYTLATDRAPVVPRLLRSILIKVSSILD